MSPAGRSRRTDCAVTSPLHLTSLPYCCVATNRRSVPGADICSAAKFTLFDNLVTEREQLIWHCKAERLGGLEIDNKLKLGRLQHR
jgi:hypothetical protein